MIINKYTNEKFDVSIDYNKLNDTDKIYCKLMENILENGLWKQNRTGTKTISIFGPQLVFENVLEKFPLLTQKKIHLKSVVGELLWFLSGSTDKNVLKNKYGVTIWDEWNAPNPKFDGDMGPIYGNQWVNWKYYEEIGNISGQPALLQKSINQIQNIIDKLKSDPDDRRMIVTAWHPEQIKDMALPPCHWSFQFYTNQRPNEDKRRLHIIENQRSVDTFLGLPFNIASYSILLMMMAQEVNMIPGDLIMNLGDTHLYENHLPFVYEQLKRISKGDEPVLKLNPDKGFWEFEPEDFELLMYDAHPNFKNVPIAV